MKKEYVRIEISVLEMKPEDILTLSVQNKNADDYIIGGVDVESLFG